MIQCNRTVPIDSPLQQATAGSWLQLRLSPSTHGSCRGWYPESKALHKRTMLASSISRWVAQPAGPKGGRSGELPDGGRQRGYFPTWPGEGEVGWRGQLQGGGLGCALGVKGSLYFRVGTLRGPRCRCVRCCPTSTQKDQTDEGSDCQKREAPPAQPWLLSAPLACCSMSLLMLSWKSLSQDVLFTFS